MAQFMAKSPMAQISGAGILSVLDGMGTFRDLSLKVLERFGIVDPKAGEWYSQQAWLDAFKEIAGKTGPNTLKVIGRRIPEVTPMPSEFDTIEKALAAMDIGYHFHHRGGEIGHYKLQKTGEKSITLVCDDPYPCNFITGVVESTARKRAPASAIVVIKHDDTAPCKSKGADSCTYHISW